MYGFTESFNISVSAALCMYDLSTRLRHSNVDYKLNETEKEELLLEWIKTSIKKCDLIIKDYMQKKAANLL
jgi:tRNA (guanosine-2'-O-)-methyltransferase